MAMQKCPVCEGRQTMPETFYTRETVTSRVPGYVECRSCHGRGIVFCPEPVSQGGSVERWEWPQTSPLRFDPAWRGSGTVVGQPADIKYVITNSVATEAATMLADSMTDAMHQMRGA